MIKTQLIDKLLTTACIAILLFITAVYIYSFYRIYIVLFIHKIPVPDGLDLIIFGALTVYVLPWLYKEVKEMVLSWRR